jgi:hypothetical protein
MTRSGQRKKLLSKKSDPVGSSKKNIKFSALKVVGPEVLFHWPKQWYNPFPVSRSAMMIPK